ncbi:MULTISPECIES: hypothetical protein [unclassified Oleiphilus]|nr:MULTISPECIES: hypothetical protein [unclassified Oleiphilus]KZY76847.1 hypothetical protein A3740_11795 [Oleiphilus sp. HI0068]KZY80142.1 hypothetical protein A3741_05970 [Oleiphilus sp. HI0069]KZZ30592.1 hypothetical protein A3755_13615 [Oleiphilus sp. HI0085]KZZ35443.1 hypothetical protein A3756_15620 [Oleiphilus sp. HI0086]KZZ55961.1 hypothetical protein A3761_10500 [Oleiphilus sp. HI0123]
MIDLSVLFESNINTTFFAFIGFFTLATLAVWLKVMTVDKKDKAKLQEELLESTPAQLLKSKHGIVSAQNSGPICIRKWPEALEEKSLGFDWMPAFVTSLGVLGTFLGISYGLSDLEPLDLHAKGSSDKLLASIGGLLEGMKVAFYTSVAGIIGGLVLSLLRHTIFLRKVRNQNIESIKALESKGFRLFDMSDMVASMGSNDMVDAAQAMAESARSFNADAIADKMTSSLSPMLERIGEELNVLSEIKKENGEQVLQKMMDDLRSQVIEPIQVRLESTAGLVDQSTTSVTKLTESLLPLGEELDQTVDKLREHQQESIASIENVLNRFQQEVGEKLSQQLISAGEILNETLEKLNTDLGAHLETLNALATQMPSLDAELVASIEAVLNQVVGTSRELLKQIQEGSDHQNAQLKELLNEVANYHGSSREFLDEYIKSVNKSSTDVHAKLLNVAQVLATAASIADSTEHSKDLTHEPA